MLHDELPQIDIISLFIRYLKNGEYAPPEILKDLRKLSKIYAVLIGPILGDALGRPEEFSPIQYPPNRVDTEGQELNMFDGGSKFGDMVKGQWTDDGSQALCLIMAYLYAINFKKQRDEENNSLTDQQFKNLLTNVFAHLLYMWNKRGVNTGFTVDQWISVKPNHQHSIGLGSVMTRFINFWRESVLEKGKGDLNTKTFDYTLNMEFLLDFNVEAEFAKYCIPLNLDKTDGNAVTMRNGASAIFLATSPTEAMQNARNQSRTTTDGDEASACAQLQAFLTYKAIHSGDEVSPLACKKMLFSKETFKEFITLFSNMEPKQELPPRIKALCESKSTWIWEDTKFLEWRCTPSEYGEKLNSFEDRTYYGAYATSGMAFIFNVIFNSTSFDQAMRDIAQSAGDADSNCAVAAQILGAIYGFENIPERWLRLINQFPLNAGIESAKLTLGRLQLNRNFDESKMHIKRLDSTKDDEVTVLSTSHYFENNNHVIHLGQDVLTRDILNLAKPEGMPVSEVRTANLVTLAAEVTNPLECQRLITFEQKKIKERHQFVKEVLEKWRFRFDENDEARENYLRALWVLKDLKVNISVKYKNKLATRILGSKIKGVFTLKEINEKKFDPEFLKKLSSGDDPIRIAIYDHLMLGSEDQSLDPLVDVNQLYSSSYEKYICIWKLYFEKCSPTPLFEKFKGSGFEFKNTMSKNSLFAYLSSLENDTSAEAEKFKCQAFHYLMFGTDWDGIKTLPEILMCDKVVTEQERRLIANNQILLPIKQKRFLEPHSFVYQRLLSLFLERKPENKNQPLTEEEKNEVKIQFTLEENKFKHMNVQSKAKYLSSEAKEAEPAPIFLEIPQMSESKEQEKIDALSDKERSIFKSFNQSKKEKMSLGLRRVPEIPVVCRENNHQGHLIFITTSRLEKILQDATRDKDLRLVETSNDGIEATLRLYYNKSANSFPKGTVHYNDAGKEYYELKINLEKNRAFEEPPARSTLFNISFTMDGNDHILNNFDRYFKNDEIDDKGKLTIQFSTEDQAEINRAALLKNNERHSLFTPDSEDDTPIIKEQEIDTQKRKTSDNLLLRMRIVNTYLTDREQERGTRDYYRKRQSWQKILEGMDDLLKPNQQRKVPYNKKPITTGNELISLIRREAEKFEGLRDVKKNMNPMKARYSRALGNLANKLQDLNDTGNCVNHLRKIERNIISYYRIYDQMDECLVATMKRKYDYSPFALFQFQKEKNVMEQVLHEQKLYQLHYNALDDEDKKTFSEPKNEMGRISENLSRLY